MADHFQDDWEECKHNAREKLIHLAINIPYQKASIQLLDDDLRSLFVAQGFREDEASRPLLRPVSTDALVAELVNNRQQIWIPDTAKDSRWQEHDTTKDVAAWLGAPIIHEDRPVGLLTLDFTESDPLISKLHEKVSRFVTTVAPVLSKARLLDGRRRLTRDMVIFNNVVKVIGEKVSRDEVLNAIAREIVEHLGCSHCTIFFLTQREGEPVLAAELAQGRGDTRTRTFRPTEGLVGVVFQSGQALVVTDASADPRFAPARTQPPNSGRSMVVAPIKVGDQTIGVISADQDRPGWFNQGDANLLQTLGQQAGIAIQRSLSLELLQDIAADIVTHTASRDILEHAVRRALQLVNATTGVIYLLDESRTAIKERFSPPTFNHPDPRLDNARGITRTVIRTGLPVRVPNLKTETRVDVSPALLQDYASMIAVPLKIRNDVIGVFFADYVDEHHFTDLEEFLLVTLASHAAVAIRQAQLRDELAAQIRRHEQLEKKLEELYQILRSSSQTNLVDQVLDLVGEGVRSMFGNEVSSTIHLTESNTSEFEPALAYGPLADRLLERTALLMEMGLAVLTQRTPVFLSDIRGQNYASALRSLQDLGVRSVAGVPLMANNQALGVLFLHSQQTLAFTDGERYSLQSFAEQAAKVIESHRLPEIVSVLRKQAFDFFTRASRSDARIVSSLQLSVPQPVRVTEGDLAKPSDVAALERLLQPGEFGYFVFKGDLPAATAEALDDLRKRRSPVVPLSLDVMTAAIADGKAKTVLAELERSYRLVDNLFETRSAVIDERFLFGRRAMLAQIGNDLRRGEHILLFGLRKSGKTSFLNILRQHFSNYPVSSVDLQRYDSEREHWPPLLFQQIVSAFDAWGRAVFGANWPAKDHVALASASEFHDAMLKRREWQTRRGRDERFLIVLDEIERVFPPFPSKDESHQFVVVAGALRSLVQGRKPFVSIIGADLRPSVNRKNQLPAGTNPFFQFFKEFPLPLLNLDDLSEMIATIGSAMGLGKPAPDFVNLLFQLTGGHPFLSRLVAAAAHDANSGDRLTVQALEHGLANLDERNVVGAFFKQNLWEQLNLDEKSLLGAYYRLGPAEVARRSPDERAALAAFGLLNGGRVQIGLFDHWLRDMIMRAS